MWKIANPSASSMQNTHRSSTGTTTVPSTAETSPQKPPSTSPTPFLRSRSEVRFALDPDFTLDSEGEKGVPPLPPIEPAVAQPNTPANNIHISPNPNQDYRTSAITRQKPSNVHVAANPNNYYRLAPRQFQPPTHPGQREDGAPVPLKEHYVTISKDDHGLDAEDLYDDLPPGLDDGLQTSMLKFAGAYAKGLGGLVMGVVDGLARGTGGPAWYMTYGAVAYAGARR